jgi:neopullulanase
MRLWPSLLLAGFLVLCLFNDWAQATHQPISQREESQIENPGSRSPRSRKLTRRVGGPVFPDPMLLVHGEGLKGASSPCKAKDVTLSRTQVSENGHWAFLWLTTATAAPQTLWVTASNNQGQARHSFQLAERSHDPNAHRGFSSADVLYLIMIDRFADGIPANKPARI